MKSIFSILVISGLAACGTSQPIQPTGSISNVKNESAILASNPICRSVRSTFFGGGETNTVTSISAIAIGNNGHVYIAGTTDSPRLPGTRNSLQPLIGPKSINTAFVAEFSGDLGTLIAATYLGSTGVGQGRALAVGKEGQIYVAGQLDWGRDFVIELTPDLRKERSFIVARAGPLRALTIAPNGNIYIAGGGSADAPGYGYVVELTSELSQIHAFTSLGGSGRNWVNAVAAAPNGDVYVAGGTSSIDFPKTLGGAQPSSSGGVKAYVVELSSSLGQVIQATYFGVNGKTEAYALAVTKQGQVYMSGNTSASDLPGINGAAQPELAGDDDVYVTELSGDLKAVVHTTYIGGTRNNWLWAMTISNDNHIYVAGATNSSDFPGTAGGMQEHMDRGFIIHPMHGFISEVSADLEHVIQSSYYIGSDHNQSYEEIRGIALGNNGYLYLTGYTHSISLPCDQLGALRHVKFYDGFVARFPDSLRTRVNNEDP